MSSNLQEITVSATNFPNFLALPVKTNIGGIDVNVAVEEVHSDTLELTEHPVETGAAITDHSYRRPSEIVLRCGWSNSDPSALKAIASGLVAGSVMSVSSYVTGIYSRLLKLQQSRDPLTIVTGLRTYQSMLIRALVVTRDVRTSQVLTVQATCKEIIVVDTQTTTLPPQPNQATPASTAETQPSGTRSLVAATPAPGGAAPPSTWGIAGPL
ncbi:MAG TPA: hypothetical protein VIE14_07365, partial [Steroidobacteraceae bacterium]